MMKSKTKSSHTVGTIPKSNVKIVERGKIDTPNTQTHNCPPSLSNTDIQQKVAGLNQFYLHKPALPAKRRGHANVIHT